MLMALNGHLKHGTKCLVLGVKRTLPFTMPSAYSVYSCCQYDHPMSLGAYRHSDVDPTPAISAGLDNWD